MTEILIDVDFGHPPERVWRALTDRAVLSEWFMRTDLEPYEGRRFRLAPDGLLGLAGPLEGELVEVVAPRKLVMLWRGEQMHSRVTWELVPLPEGCRLRMSHTGFIGVRGSLRRRELQRAYDRMLADRLPAVLDALASGTPAAPQASPKPVGLAARPAVPVPADGDALPRRRWLPALPHHRRGQLLAAASAVLLAVLTAAVITGLGAPSFIPPVGAAPSDGPLGLPTSDPTSGRGVAASDGASAPGAPTPAATGSPGAPAAVAGVGGSSPGPTPPPDGQQNPPTGADAWEASYQTVSSSASGFTGSVTVANRTSAEASGWVVRVTLPAGARLAKIKWAVGTQSGTTVTLIPKTARETVGPGKSVTVQIQVSGASAPTGCSVDGGRCTGIPG